MRQAGLGLMYRQGVRLQCTPGAKSFVYFLRLSHGVLAARGTPASIQALPLPLSNYILREINTRKAKCLVQGHTEQMNQRTRWLVSPLQGPFCSSEDFYCSKLD